MDSAASSRSKPSLCKTATSTSMNSDLQHIPESDSLTIDYFSSSHSKPALIGKSTDTHLGPGTPRTPGEAFSAARPSWCRTVTSQTLNFETKKFFDALEDDTAEASTIAFALDIDGVLVKGKTPVPGARETIKKLQESDIPFIFLTNGGGLTEKAHVARVGQRLDLTLDENQFVQSHTPFFDLVPKYKDSHILVLGGHGNNVRDLALAYGFNKVLTSSDLMAEWADIHPFPELTKAHHVEHGRRLEQPHSVEIAAILVWSSPRDWCLDLQVITDLLLSSGGKFNKKSDKAGDISLPNNGYLQDGQPKLYFCNPDFEWATQHEHPRFAQGAFREALKGVWAYATKGRANLEYTVIGKPMNATFTYGERTLQAYNDQLNQRRDRPRRIRRVYMIGDNPESDIRGANSFTSHMGAEWKSILVESGVHEPGTKPAYLPDFIAKDIKEAVEEVMSRENAELDAELQGRRLGLMSLAS